MKPLNIDSLWIKAKSLNRTNTRRRATRILAILHRDNFKCVKCGRSYDLTIDHPNGRKFARYDNAQKYRPDECQVLCVKCHLNKNKQKEVIENE